MDKLRRSMFRTLLSEHWDEGVEPAVDMALLGRYYERIGDHAVSMARRIVFLVTGQHPATSDVYPRAPSAPAGTLGYACAA